MDVISIGIEHLNQCLALDKLSLKGLWGKSQWEKELADKSRLCFGISFNSNLVGIACCWLVLDELQITAIAVHPNSRRLGVGEKLLSHLLKESRTLGAKKAFLEVKSSNLPAISLYKKVGFKENGYRRKYFKDGSDAKLFFMGLENKKQRK